VRDGRRRPPRSAAGRALTAHRPIAANSAMRRPSAGHVHHATPSSTPPALDGDAQDTPVAPGPKRHATPRRTAPETSPPTTPPTPRRAAGPPASSHRDLDRPPQAPTTSRHRRRRREAAHTPSATLWAPDAEDRPAPDPQPRSATPATARTRHPQQLPPAEPTPRVTSRPRARLQGSCAQPLTMRLSRRNERHSG